MPKLPTKQDFGARPVPRSNQAVISADASAIGEAQQYSGRITQEIGKNIDDVVKERVEKENDRDASLAELEWTKRQIDIEKKLENEPDWNKHEKMYQQLSDAALNDVVGGVRNNDLREKVKISLQSDVIKNRKKVYDNAISMYNDSELARVMQSMDESKQLLFETTDPEKRQKIFNGINSQISSLRDRRIIDAINSQKMKSGFAADYSISRLSSMTDEEKVQALSASEENTFADFIPATQRASLLEGAKNRLKAKTKISAREQYSFISDLYSAGIEPDEGVLDSAISLAKAADEPDIVKSIGDMKETWGDVKSFVNDTTYIGQKEAVKKAYDEARKNQTPKALRKYTALNTALEAKQKYLATDPIGYYESINAIEEHEPLNIDDREQLMAEVSKRRVSKEIIKARDGFNVPLLKKEDIALAKDIYSNGTLEQKVGLVDAYASVFTPEERRSIAQVLAKDAPMMATAFVLDKPDDIKLLVEGDITQSEISSDEMRKYVNDEIGDMVFDAETLEGAHSAVYAVYKGLAVNKGLSGSDTKDEKTFNEAIKIVLGEPVKIGGFGTGVNPSKVFSYKRDDGKFADGLYLQDMFNSITDQALAAAAGGMPVGEDMLPVPIERLLKRGEFISTSDGHYGVRLKNASGGYDMLKMRNGNIFDIDARKLEKYLHTTGWSFGTDINEYLRDFYL